MCVLILFLPSGTVAGKKLLWKRAVCLSLDSAAAQAGRSEEAVAWMVTVSDDRLGTTGTPKPCVSPLLHHLFT